MKREFLFHAFFLTTFLILLYDFGRILEPFLAPILGALVLWILSYPLHRRLSRLWPRRGMGFQSALSTLVMVALVVGPFLLLCWLLFNESESVRPQLEQWSGTLMTWGHSDKWLSLPVVGRIQVILGHTLGLGRMEFQRVGMQMVGGLFTRVSDTGQAIAKNAIVSAFQLLVVVFTLFFLFRDGERWLEQLKGLIPMRRQDKEHILQRLKSTVTELVRGSIVTAVIQGACAAIAYLIVGVPAALTLGVLTAVASVIPVMGSALIWLPIGAGFLLQGQLFKGFFILAWGVLVIVTLDNFLRSWLVGKKARLPVFFLFFGLLGGVEVYGAKGLLIGPVLVAVIPVFIDIYKGMYLEQDE